MRILIWNMQGGSPGGSLAKHESAWRYLRERDPDVALLQEATVPAWAEERWGSVIHEARRRGPKARGWGSAVIAKDEGFERFAPGEETPWLDRFRGGVVLARAPWNQWFASIHVSAQAERLSPDDAAGVALCAPPKVWEVDLVTHDLGHFFEGRRFVAYKLSKRFDQDISAVCAGISIGVEAGHVTDARIAFGGMAATPRRARACEAALAGRPWTRATIDAAAQALARDFTPITDMRASAAYRLDAAQNILIRAFVGADGAGVRAAEAVAYG